MIDTDLYQLISLGLSAIAVIVLLALTSTLIKVRKLLEERSAVQAEPRAGASAPPERTDTPAAGAPVTATPVTEQTAPVQAAQTVTQEPAARVEQEPQEQPFERDGRWWYRRGEELLVYDEQTGQWTPAPEGSPGPASMPAAETGEATAAPAESDAFWRCPSCGAVNGSTATSCRMCFTARP